MGTMRLFLDPNKVTREPGSSIHWIHLGGDKKAFVDDVGGSLFYVDGKPRISAERQFPKALLETVLAVTIMETVYGEQAGNIPLGECVDEKVTWSTKQEKDATISVIIEALSLEVALDIYHAILRGELKPQFCYTKVDPEAAT